MYKNILGVLILLMFMGCSAAEEQKTDPVMNTENTASEQIPVKVIRVTPDDFMEYGTYYGTASGINKAVLSPSLGGAVEKISVTEGDLVSEGMSLGEINTARAENNFEKAVLSERMSRNNYEMKKNFLETGIASAIQVDEAHLNWLQARGALLDAEKTRDEAFCITPIDGTVLSINIEEFEEIPPGRETFIIEDLSRMKITIGIPESEMDGIRENSEADVTFSTYPGRTWKGKLISFSRISSEQNRTFEARIEVDNSDGTIMSGATARVKLLRNEYRQKLVIPVETVRIIGDRNYAMAVDGDKVVSKEIETGPSDSRVIIIRSGLEEGDLIIKEGIHLVSNGSSVKIME